MSAKQGVVLLVEQFKKDARELVNKQDYLDNLIINFNNQTPEFITQSFALRNAQTTSLSPVGIQAEWYKEERKEYQTFALNILSKRIENFSVLIDDLRYRMHEWTTSTFQLARLRETHPFVSDDSDATMLREFVTSTANYDAVAVIIASAQKASNASAKKKKKLLLLIESNEKRSISTVSLVEALCNASQQFNQLPTSESISSDTSGAHFNSSSSLATCTAIPSPHSTTQQHGSPFIPFAQQSVYPSPDSHLSAAKSLTMNHKQSSRSAYSSSVAYDSDMLSTTAIAASPVVLASMKVYNQTPAVTHTRACIVQSMVETNNNMPIPAPASFDQTALLQQIIQQMASIAQRVDDLAARVPPLNGIGSGTCAQSRDPNEIGVQSTVKGKKRKLQNKNSVQQHRQQPPPPSVKAKNATADANGKTNTSRT